MTILRKRKLLCFSSQLQNHMTGRYQKDIDVKAHCASTVILLAGILDTPWSRERYAKLCTSTVLFRTTGYIL